MALSNFYAYMNILNSRDISGSQPETKSEHTQTDLRHASDMGMIEP